SRSASSRRASDSVTDAPASASRSSTIWKNSAALRLIPSLKGHRIASVSKDAATNAAIAAPVNEITAGRALVPAHRLVAARARRRDDQHGCGAGAVVPHRAPELGIDADEGARGRGVILTVDHHRRLPVEHDEDLFLVAVGLVVLGNRLACWDRDEAHPERAEPERAAEQDPVAVPLDVVAVDDGEAG